MSDNECEDKLVKEMTDFLFTDFNDGLATLIKNDSQYLRRSFIRALFAAIESVIFGMKTEILNRNNKANPPFTIGELAILEEKSFSLNKNGNIIEAPKFLEIKKNISFVFRAYGRSYGTQLELNVADDGWKNFVEIVNVRNRITHPKSKNDIVITNDEIIKTKLVYNWFNQQHLNSIKTTTEALKAQLDKHKNQKE